MGCYLCGFFIPLFSGKRILDNGLCNLTEDPSCVFSVNKNQECIYRDSYNKLSQEEVDERDKKYLEETKKYEKHIKNVRLEIASWPEWKRNLIYG